MDKERSLLLPCLFYFIISWSLVAAGGKGKNEGRVVHAAGGLSELGGGAPPCRLSYPSYVSLTTSPGLGNTWTPIFFFLLFSPKNKIKKNEGTEKDKIRFLFLRMGGDDRSLGGKKRRRRSRKKVLPILAVSPPPPATTGSAASRGHLEQGWNVAAYVFFYKNVGSPRLVFVRAGQNEATEEVPTH